MFKAKVTVSLKKTVLDPQGMTVEKAVRSMGFKTVSDVRVGKSVELLIDAKDAAKAKADLEDICKKLLANPIIEQYSFTVEEVK
jgi:phosphoribosylformylglycinamidine synthase